MKNILVVEDEKYYRFTLARSLSRYGKVDEAQCLAEAKNLLNSVTYDIVFADLNLSDSLEIEGLKVIEIASSKKIPVIAITSNDNKAIVEKAFTVGAKQYFVKDRFLENVDSCLKEVFQSFSLDTSQIFTSDYITSSKELKSQIEYVIGITNPMAHSVLITGPTGVGKTKIAKTIHKNSSLSGPCRNRF